MRPIETLRGHVFELQMAQIRHEVNEVNIAPYPGTTRGGCTLNVYPCLAQSRATIFEHLIWWGEALKGARIKTAVESELE